MKNINQCRYVMLTSAYHTARAWSNTYKRKLSPTLPFRFCFTCYYNTWGTLSIFEMLVHSKCKVFLWCLLDSSKQSRTATIKETLAQHCGSFWCLLYLSPPWLYLTEVNIKLYNIWCTNVTASFHDLHKNSSSLGRQKSFETPRGPDRKDTQGVTS